MKIDYVFGIFLIGAFVVLMLQNSDDVTLHKKFIVQEVNGRLLELRNVHKGNYRLFIRRGYDTITCKLLISWFITENKVKVGDSISKAANNERIFFYRKEHGLYKEYAVYH